VGTSHLLHGYVYEDEFAHGIYFVDWCDGDHPRRSAFLTLALGAFGEGTTSADRLAFGIEWRTDGIALLDEPARDRPALLGSFVPRDQALAMETIGHLWHVVDHIVLDDPRLAPVQQWLDQCASS
jgi:hypothetical protein